MMKNVLNLMTADKALHFMYSFMLVVVIAAVLSVFGGAYPIFMAGVFTFIIGYIKEFIIDRHFGGNTCWWDMLANGIGIIVAIGCLLLI